MRLLLSMKKYRSILLAVFIIMASMQMIDLPLVEAPLGGVQEVMASTEEGAAAPEEAAPAEEGEEAVPAEEGEETVPAEEGGEVY